MEKLWSPWRSQYIESFQKPKEKNKCIFCGAIEEEENENCLVVNRGKLTFTILNLYPYNNGHLMVVPKRHLSDFELLNDEENLEIMKELQYAQTALKIVSNPDGFNLGANIGKVSGAGIAEHIHFHIVPRWSGDTNFMPVLGDVKVLSQDLLITKKKLMEAFESIKKKDN
ncbi:MAG TPA: HIT family hydrolase [Bacteroidetes bacterium]|nr:HIT family hydrolase [Bacteroidota bacterium]HRI46518.1 HIT domain-containing protein [Ignavibacteriaceae bacterium]